jgi:hypothetical protein
MSQIKAIDGCVLRGNGTAFPVPTGTEMNISKNNAAGLVIKDTELNGDGNSTALYARTRAHISGLVVSLDTEALEDEFLELCALEDVKWVLDNGQSFYSIEKGAIISPQENGTPEINHITRKTEAFEIRSMTGTIIARVVE